MDSDTEIRFFVCMNPDGTYQVLGSSKHTEDEIKAVVVSGMENPHIMQYKMKVKPPETIINETA